jgi:hypothetical protein
MRLPAGSLTNDRSPPEFARWAAALNATRVAPAGPSSMRQDKPVPRWSFQLVGEHVDLEQLATLFPSGPVRVQPRESQFWLEADEIDAEDDGTAAWDVAGGLLLTLNGIAVRSIAGSGLVTLGRQERIDESGRRHITVHPKSAAVTARVGIPTIQVSGVALRSKHARLLQLAARDEEVEAVLRLYGSRAPDWRDLYFVLELVEDDAGADADRKGWLTASERRRFMHMADNRRALGDLARHGHKKFDLPKKPMTLAEARRLIDIVVEKWIRSKMR